VKEFKKTAASSKGTIGKSNNGSNGGNLKFEQEIGEDDENDID
jgi:hypothetical protein